MKFNLRVPRTCIYTCMDNPKSGNVSNQQKAIPDWAVISNAKKSKKPTNCKSHRFRCVYQESERSTSVVIF